MDQVTLPLPSTQTDTFSWVPSERKTSPEAKLIVPFCCQLVSGTNGVAASEPHPSTGVPAASAGIFWLHIVPTVADVTLAPCASVVPTILLASCCCGVVAEAEVLAAEVLGLLEAEPQAARLSPIRARVPISA